MYSASPVEWLNDAQMRKTNSLTEYNWFYQNCCDEAVNYKNQKVSLENRWETKKCDSSLRQFRETTETDSVMSADDYERGEERGELY
jgi:hypothetical protein